MSELNSNLAPGQLEALQAPLHMDQVSSRESFGGNKLDYLEGWAAIENANRVFGFDGWEYEVLSTSPTHAYDFETKTGKKMSAVCYTAMVRVRALGCTRSDVGYGNGMGPEGKGEEHELAIKEAVTDALKRALRSFGDQFGNTLYNKEKTKRNVLARKSSAQAKTDGDDERVKSLINQANTLYDLREAWEVIEGELLPTLPRSWEGAIREQYDKRWETLEAQES